MGFKGIPNASTFAIGHNSLSQINKVLAGTGYQALIRSSEIGRALKSQRQIDSMVNFFGKNQMLLNYWSGVEYKNPNFRSIEGLGVSAASGSLVSYLSARSFQVGSALNGTVVRDYFSNNIMSSVLQRIMAEDRVANSFGSLRSLVVEHQSILDKYRDYVVPIGLTRDLTPELSGLTIGQLFDLLQEGWSDVNDMPVTDSPKVPESTGACDTIEEPSKLSQMMPLAIIIFQILILFIVSWNDIRQNVTDFNDRLPESARQSTPSKFIRKHLKGMPGDVRLVASDNVKLRMSVGMKAKILIPLPRYAIVAVMEKIDRDWLLVEYEHDGAFLEGYVSTKFLRKTRPD